jgi:hypothetical protein
MHVRDPSQVDVIPFEIFEWAGSEADECQEGHCDRLKDSHREKKGRKFHGRILRETWHDLALVFYERQHGNRHDKCEEDAEHKNLSFQEVSVDVVFQVADWQSNFLNEERANKQVNAVWADTAGKHNDFDEKPVLELIVLSRHIDACWLFENQVFTDFGHVENEWHHSSDLNDLNELEETFCRVLLDHHGKPAEGMHRCHRKY